MKKVNLLIILIIGLFITTKVEAITYTDEDIEDYSIVIGSHLFTTETEESTGYNGLLTTKFAMLGASSITDYEDVNDMIIYYKWGLDDWTDYITQDTVYFPESVNITHINGVCVDPSCNGTVIDVTLVYNDATAYNNETPSVTTHNPYQSIFAEPVTPTKLGYDFICWELDGECYDFDTVLEENITLEATWTPRTYNVTYHNTLDNTQTTLTCDFASAEPCAYIDFDDDLLFELVDGYTFAGWSIAETGEKVYNDNNIIALFGENTDIDLYSIFGSETYNIYYDLVGGSFSSTVKPDFTYDPLDKEHDLFTPYKVGYTFNGWVVDTEASEGTAVVNDLKLVISSIGNITLKASWKANEYNIVYNNNGAKIDLNTTTCTYDSNCALDFNKITVPSGKKIKEIYVTVNNNTYVIGNTVKNLTTSSEDLTATVEFTDIIYNISYDYAGGIGAVNTTEMKFGDTLALNTPSKDGYTFSGWSVSSGLSLSNNTITLKTAGDATVTAKWTPNTYNVYYKNGTADILLSTSGCTYDEFCTLDLSKIVLASGYQLDHIEATIDGSTSVVGDKVFNLTTTANGKFYVTPIFEEIQYNITYNLNGGKITNENSSVITVGTTLTLTEPTREGYTFAGWEVTSGSANVTNTSVVLKDVGDVSLKAKWDVKQFTIDFDLNDGIGTVSSVSCTYVSCELPDTIPTKTGYDFDGWMYEGALYEAGDNVTIEATGTITLTAKWVNSEVYKIKYDLDGGTFNGTPVITFIAGDTIVLPEPTRDGYEFKGWYSGNTEITSVSGLTADVEVTAKWSPISYTIYLYADSEGNELLNEIYCEYDDTCGLGDNSNSFDHQRLLGWSKSAGGNVFYGDNLQLMNLVTNAGDSVHLYPVLETLEDDFVVTYYLDGGSFVDESIVIRSANDGDSITLPVVEKFGYEVDYWITDSGIEITTDTYEISSDVVLVPVWKERTTYTVNFVHDFDTSYTTESITCTFDSECILPTLDFDREGYNFDGWLLQLTGEGGNATFEDGDLFGMSWEIAVDQGTFEFELTSQWSEITYDVYYVNEDNENTVLTTYSYFDDSVKISLNIASKSDGSTFVAWSLEDGTILDVCTDDTNYACLSVTELTRDIKLTPHYSDELVTVTYSANYSYTDRGEEQTASDNGSLSILPGMKITGLPESVSYQRGPNTTTVNIVGWTLDDIEINLDEYVVTTAIELVAIFE